MYLLDLLYLLIIFTYYMYNPLKIKSYKHTRKYKPNSTRKTRRKSRRKNRHNITHKHNYTKKSKKSKKSKKNKKNKKGGDNIDLSTADYNTNFKGTELIPNTSITQYIISNYYNYIEEKNSMDRKKKSVLNLKDCFDFKNKLDNTNNKQFIFRGEVHGNTDKWKLDKLISYIFYITMSSTFNPQIDNSREASNKHSMKDQVKQRLKFYMFMSRNKNIVNIEDKDVYINRIIKELKYQIGKDVRRDNRLINGKQYTAEMFLDEKKTNYQITDMYYSILMDTYTASNITINNNTINLICLLSCQNIFNLITDLIVMQVNSMVQPEMSAVMNASKNINIEITPTIEMMRFSFKSSLLISENMFLDPEKSCGIIEFTLEIDIKNKTYKFTNLWISYNVITCQPEIPEEEPKEKEVVKKGSEPSMYVNNNVNMNTPCDDENNNLCDDENYLKYNDNEDDNEDAKEDAAKNAAKGAKESITANMMGKLKNSKLYNNVFNNKDVDFTTEILPVGISALAITTGPYVLGAIGGKEKKEKKNKK